MTAALKAMVDAMAVELVRQRDAKELIPMQAAEVSRRDGPDGSYATGEITSAYLMGSFDLEKVGRAGLEAVDHLDGDTVWQHHDGWDADVAGKIVHRRVISAILGGKP